MFDFGLFKAILDRSGVDMGDVYAMEVEVLNRVDLAELGKPSVYTSFVDLGLVKFGLNLHSRYFYNYMQNYLFYLLIVVNDQNNLLLHCLASSLFFFMSRNDNKRIHDIVFIIKHVYKINSGFLRKLEKLIGLTAKNLKILGNESDSVDKIAKKIDIRDFFN